MKKYFKLITLTIIIMLIMPLFVKAETKKTVKNLCGTAKDKNIICDINLDGKVTTEDAELLLKYVVEKIPLNFKQIALSDTNGDQETNTGDVVMILRFLANSLTDPNNGEAVCKEIYYNNCRVGDVNCNGKINDTDAMLVLGHSVNLSGEEYHFNTNQLLLAEVNSDKEVNTGDAAAILNYVEKGHKYFPIECKRVITSTDNDDDNNTEPTPINNPSDISVDNPKTGDVPVYTLILICTLSLGLAIYEVLKLKKIK